MVGTVLLICVVVLVPIMLCVKPCCFRNAPVHDDGDEEIELTEGKKEGKEGKEDGEVSEKLDASKEK